MSGTCACGPFHRVRDAAHRGAGMSPPDTRPTAMHVVRGHLTELFKIPDFGGQVHGRPHDAAPDRERFLVVIAAEAAQGDIVVVPNWIEKLKARAKQQAWHGMGAEPLSRAIKIAVDAHHPAFEPPPSGRQVTTKSAFAMSMPTTVLIAVILPSVTNAL